MSGYYPCEVCEKEAMHVCSGLDVPPERFCQEHAEAHARDCGDITSGRATMDVVEGYPHRPIAAPAPMDDDSDAAARAAMVQRLGLEAELDELREALRACADALDRLMGDTDLDGDDSPEYRAIRRAVALLEPHERADAPEVGRE